MHRNSWLIACATLLVWPGSLLPQSVRGTVKNAATGEPVADASIVLLNKNGRVARGTLSEPDGSYVLVAPESGRYTLRVGGAGFVTQDSPEIDLRRGEAAQFSFSLVPEGGVPGLAEFERRRAMGKGIFLTAEDIRQRGGNRFTTVLTHVPGVTVVPLADIPREGRVPDDSVAILSSHFTVRLAGSLYDRTPSGARQHMEPTDDCPPVLFVDGSWWGTIDDAGPLGPDHELIPKDLLGIEIYTPATVPRELDIGLQSRCGVIVVWRKR